MELLKVLAVDDEQGMRMGMERALRRTTVHLPEVDVEVGFEVETAESGEEALAKIEAGTPDILLLDYKMGGMSGLDVLEKLGTRKDQMLTVMVTAYASLETAVTAIKRGAYDFLAKPFTPTELKATIRKAAEGLILARQARKLAQEKRRVRFEFISVLSHELKAPLAAIEGYLNIMRDRTAGETLDNYDEMIGRSLVRVEGMRKLIFDLLDLTRIESGQKQRSLSEVDLRKLAEEAIETAEPAAEEKEVTVRLEGPETLTMMGDAGELEIIFNNLVSNAVKYNRQGGQVTVRLEGGEEQVTIEVEDTGIGMSQEEAGKLFNDFVRIKNEKTRNITGSGLGLSTVKKLAYLYGGTAKVKSEPDVGSTFTVVLKREQREQKSGADAVGDTAVAEGSG